jgi:hypothetical protein
MNNSNLLRVSFLFAAFLLLSQDIFSQGKVTIVGAERLEQVISTRTRVSQGYRIQVFFGNDRKTAEEVREKIRQGFPDLDVYFLYQQPNYKIRVGNYSSIIQAQVDLYRLGALFKGSFIVPDQIEAPK